ncbi:MAG: PfkB family carbohydrate kinase, partial [Patescibacteria group bacterium]|nr:PfkB family carbohydrate kinase [Patescibacteria group bacterium]
MAQNPRILTIGSATLDLFICETKPAFTEIDLGADKKGLVLEEGTKFEITDLNGMSGGGATNAARVLNRFGLPVTAFFKTADDQISEKITSILRNDGIDIRPALNTSTTVSGKILFVF